MTIRLDFDTVTRVNRARCQRWHPGFPSDDLWNGADWANAMQGEAGEAGNIVKKLRRLECNYADQVTGLQWNELGDMLAEELADVYLYLDLLAQKYNIDLPTAIVAKFNKVSQEQHFPERLTLQDTELEEAPMLTEAKLVWARESLVAAIEKQFERLGVPAPDPE